VLDVFDHPVIQRCQLHKLRNVTDRLPDAAASTVAKRMRAAYRNPDPLVAQADLEALARELDRSHPGAAGSLREGLAETLTIGPAWRAANAGSDASQHQFDLGVWIAAADRATGARPGRS
jgi:transposase-like protein